MGFYDEDGVYHTSRQRSDQVADKGHARLDTEAPGDGPPPDDSYLPATISIPCSHIRLGDFLMLQGRPCQVIRISTSSATGQHRYLGVDVFTTKPHEESSSMSNPAPGVVIQNMLGPIFKQYRVMDMQEGHVTAITEVGDVIGGIPLLDQSNLSARLQQAFESGRASIRVLVLSDGRRELAVDFKVVHGSRLGEGSKVHVKSLHQYASLGQGAEIDALLKQGTDVNELDKDKRTALFGAVEQCHTAVVLLLLDADINQDLVDNDGRTALGIAVSNPKSHSIAMLLLANRASPTAGIEDTTLELINASAKGEAEAVSDLIRNGEGDRNLSAGDCLGYTPLHEAACYGHHKIVSMLIEVGADVDASITLGGDTVLHAVVTRGRDHRQFFIGDRARTPTLDERHVMVVAILLQSGASTELRRKDGLTMQALVSKELKSRDLKTTERHTLEQILIVLRKVPHARENVENEPAGRMGWWNSLHRRIQYFVPKSDTGPHRDFAEEFLFSQHRQDYGRSEIEKTEKLLDKDLVDRCWRWLHLPANHESWIQGAIRSLSSLDPSNECPRAFEAYSKGLHGFIDDTFNEISCPLPHPPLRSPSFTPFAGSQGGIFSLVMPYFDVESLDWQEEVNNPNFHDAEGLYIPCTLDQSYHWSLIDSRSRDRDQVVLKHQMRQRPPGTPPPPDSMILVVKQMWLWKVDTKTLLTAFPPRKHEYETRELLASITEAMQQDPPSSIDMTVFQMLKGAIDFFGSPNNAGFDESLFSIFDQSIAYRSKEEADCYDEFHRAQTTLRARNEAGKSTLSSEERERIQEEMCDIAKEVDQLREIKDIRDELAMIERVLENQKTALQQYQSAQGGQLQPEEGTLPNLEETVQGRIANVKKLSENALSVENSLNHLLDIKQKQGTLNTARDTRRLADQAEKRALDGEWQTKLLFIFTIVTVFFTPISFASSFLAVPSQDFPKDSADGNVAWRWWHIFVATVVTEVVTFGAIWVVQREEVQQAWAKIQSPWKCGQKKGIRLMNGRTRDIMYDVLP